MLCLIGNKGKFPLELAEGHQRPLTMSTEEGIAQWMPGPFVHEPKTQGFLVEEGSCWLCWLSLDPGLALGPNVMD